MKWTIGIMFDLLDRAFQKATRQAYKEFVGKD